MSNYTTNNLRFLLTKYKNEITNDNVEIAFDDEDDGLDWLQRDIISGEHARRMAEQEKKTEKPDYTTGLIDVKNIGKSKSGIDFSMFDADEEDIDAELDTSWIEELVKPEFKKKKFEKYLEKSGLKQTTIKNHMRNLDKYEKLEEGRINQDSIYNAISKSNLSKSQKLTITSTLSKYLQFIKQPNDKIVRLIFEINNDLKTGYLERNVSKSYEYTKQDILKQMNKFFDEGKYKHFIISYLVYNYNVRNTDLNLLLCKDKPKNQERYNYLYYNDKELKKVLVDGSEKFDERNEKIKKLIELELFYRKVKGLKDYEISILAPDAAMRIEREKMLTERAKTNRLLSEAYGELVDSDDEEAQYKNSQEIKNLEKKLKELKEEEKELYPPSDEEEEKKLRKKIIQYGTIQDQVGRLVTEAKRNLKVDNFVEYPEDEEIEEKKDDDDDMPEYIVNHYFTPIYFVRNNYKTSKTYGQKVYKILDKKFHIAFHTYRDIMLPDIQKEENISEKRNWLTKSDWFQRYAPDYLRPPKENELIALDEFYALQEQKIEALKTMNLSPKETKSEDERKHKQFLREEYMDGGPDDRFTGFMDVFLDILNYVPFRNKKPNAVIPYIRYKRRGINFIGSPAYWQRQKEIVTQLLLTEEYKDWYEEKKRLRSIKSVKQIRALVNSKRYAILRFERQYKTAFKYDERFLIEQDENKDLRITYDDSTDNFYFYGTDEKWREYVSYLRDVLKTLKKNLDFYRELLKEKEKSVLKEKSRNIVGKVGTVVKAKDISFGEDIYPPGMSASDFKEIDKLNRLLDKVNNDLLNTYDEIDDEEIRLIPTKTRRSEKLQKLEEQLPVLKARKERILADIQDFELTNRLKARKSMKGGGRKSNLQKFLEFQDKVLLATYDDPEVRAKIKREWAQAREEQETKAEMEKQRKKAERTAERKRKFAEARERKAKERKAKERAKEQRKALREAKKKLDLPSIPASVHKKPVGVVLYPDSYLEQMKSKMTKDSSAENQPLPLTPYAQRIIAFNKVYPDEVKRSEENRQKNASISRGKTVSTRKTKKSKIDCINIFPEPFYNSTNIVKRYLPYNLKTSDIVKIILKEDNTLSEASSIGSKRGTSLKTLQDSYNLNNKKDLD